MRDADFPPITNWWSDFIRLRLPNDTHCVVCCFVTPDPTEDDAVLVHQVIHEGRSPLALRKLAIHLRTMASKLERRAFSLEHKRDQYCL